MGNVGGSGKPPKNSPFNFNGIPSMRPAHMRMRPDTPTDTVVTKNTEYGSGTYGFENGSGGSEENLAPRPRDGHGILETVRISVTEECVR
jgi:hypothetical protein